MEKLKFSFKLHFKNGSTKFLGGKASKPENLKYDFDGLLSWEDYHSFSDKERSAKEVVNLAYKLYKNAYNDQIVKVEIVNIETDETIVSSN